MTAGAVGQYTLCQCAEQRAARPLRLFCSRQMVTHRCVRHEAAGQNDTSCSMESQKGVNTAAEVVRYFAYGANMARSTLAKRDVRPLSACPAKMSNYHSIAFRHRGGYATIIEKSTAAQTWLSIAQSPPVSSAQIADTSVDPHHNGRLLEYCGPHGVLYELKQADMRKLATRESGYSLGSTQVTLYSGDRLVALMFTSQSLLRLPASVPPQQRYLELLLEGAQSHALATEYTEWLHGLPCARPGGLGSEYFDTPSELLALCAAVSLACAATYAAVH